LILGKKQYDLKGHTGNIHATITDRKLQIEGSGGLHNGYKADVMFKADYYPFGMLEPGRNVNPTESRFAFQGMETDAAISGTGNSYTTYFRQYDPRIGRWKTTDPVIQANFSPYVGFNNNPIYYTDPKGDICGGAILVAALKITITLGATAGAEAASVAPHFSNNTNYLEGNSSGNSAQAKFDSEINKLHEGSGYGMGDGAASINNSNDLNQNMDNNPGKYVDENGNPIFYSNGEKKITIEIPDEILEQFNNKLKEMSEKEKDDPNFDGKMEKWINENYSEPIQKKYFKHILKEMEKEPLLNLKEIIEQKPFDPNLEESIGVVR